MNRRLRAVAASTRESLTFLLVPLAQHHQHHHAARCSRWCNTRRIAMTSSRLRSHDGSMSLNHQRRSFTHTFNDFSTTTTHSSSSSSTFISPDDIAFDTILEVSESHQQTRRVCSTDYSDQRGASGGSSTTRATTSDGEYEEMMTSSSINSSVCASSYREDEYEEVKVVDQFARSKIVNFLRRTASKSTSTPADTTSSSSVFETLPSVLEGKFSVVRCRIQLPLPQGHFFAEGLASNNKDAEILAAMHAERVIDAMGVQLYSLPSMQERHAKGAIAAGRWAPMPQDKKRPLGTELPPRLKMFGAAASPHGSMEPSPVAGTSSPAHNNTSSAASAMTRKHTNKHQSNHASKPESMNGSPISSRTDSSSLPSIKQGMDQQPLPPLNPGTISGPDEPTEEEQELLDRMPSITKVLMMDPRQFTQQFLNRFPVPAVDHTEGRQWCLVNLVSARKPLVDVALLLPNIFDKQSELRVQQWFHDSGRSWEREQTVSHVETLHVLQGRMILVEVPIANGFVAKGKAFDRTVAAQLAGMHAELIIDFLGLRLYLNDDEKQLQHAVAVGEYGRWAVLPEHPDDEDPPHDKSDPKQAPLPIKQLPGANSVTEGINVYSVRSDKLNLTRQIGERIVTAHNEMLAETQSHSVECFPEPNWMDNSVRWIKSWLKRTGCKYPGLFIPTDMGDMTRVTLLLPVPERYGVRGGTGISRNTEDAMKLCAVNAVDQLSNLGIPIFEDPAEQLRFAKDKWSKGQPHTPFVGDGETVSEGSFFMRPVTTPSCRPYHIEGYETRAMPKWKDINEIVKLDLVDDYAYPDFVQLGAVPGKVVTMDEVINMGNKFKPLVLKFIMRVNPESDRPQMQQWAFVLQSGARDAGTVMHNVCFVPLVLPKRYGGRRVLCVGAAGRKKDADRMAFLHAYSILKLCGVNWEQEDQRHTKEAALDRQIERCKRRLEAVMQPSERNQVNARLADLLRQREKLEEEDVVHAADVASQIPLPKPFLHPSLDVRLLREIKLKDGGKKNVHMRLWRKSYA